MLTEQQRSRFAILQQRAEDGALMAADQRELNSLVLLIEAQESEYLRPATERIRKERLQIQSQNAALKSLVRREERLVRRLERALAQSQTERAAIRLELSHIVGTSASGAIGS